MCVVVCFARCQHLGRAAWRVSWCGLFAWAYCCCSAQTLKHSNRRLVDLWTGGRFYFGARCCLRQSIVDVCSGTPTTGRRLTLADVVLGFMGRSALHGLTVHCVTGCPQPDSFLVTPRAHWRILCVFCPNFICLCGTCSTARGVGSSGTGR